MVGLLLVLLLQACILCQRYFHADAVHCIQACVFGLWHVAVAWNKDSATHLVQVVSMDLVC